MKGATRDEYRVNFHRYSSVTSTQLLSNQAFPQCRRCSMVFKYLDADTCGYCKFELGEFEREQPKVASGEQGAYLNGLLTSLN